MNQHNCSNCGAPLADKYCSHCGQKAETHRFSTKHIFAHDFIHGVFHLDKGFLFTAKELLVRPGYSIREYVEGKRVNHFNYVTFILLLITVNVFIHTTFHVNIAEIFNDVRPDANKLQIFMLQHLKEIQLLQIPFIAAINYFVFSKSRQNFAEMVVMCAYWQAGFLLIGTIIILLVALVPGNTAKLVLVSLNIPIMLIYTIRFYTQYFSKDYKSKFWLKMRIVFAAQIAPSAMAVLITMAIYFINADLLVRIFKSIGLA
jgi:hypothetical protein